MRKNLIFIALALLLIVNVFALTEEEANSNNQLPQEIKEFTDEICTEDGCEQGIESFPMYNLTSCGTISSPGIYVLKNNVTANQNCLWIDSPRVLVFCDNNYIVHSREKAGKGIQATNVSRIMILSCNIVQGNITTGSIKSYGISLKNVSKSRIIDNSIFSRANNTAISVKGLSNFNKFVRNKIISRGDGFEIESSGDSMNTLVSNSFNIPNGYDLYILNGTESTSKLRLIDQQIKRYFFPTNGILLDILRKDLTEIEFLSSVTGFGENGTDNFFLGNDSVWFSSESNSGLNKPARITFMNLTLNLTDPVVFRDGVVCENCSNLTSEVNPALISTLVSFTVPGSGNYTIGERPIDNGSNNSSNQSEGPQQLIPKSSEPSGCRTSWTCTSWSACTDPSQSGNPTQSRTCEKVESFCYAEAKPAETQSCVIQNLATTPTNENTNQGVGSRITGAVTGVGNTIANSRLTLLLVLILIILSLYYLLKQKYQNKNQNKSKKQSAKLVSLLSWLPF